MSNNYLQFYNNKMLLLFIISISTAFAQLSVLPTWIGNPYLETNSYQVITDFDTTSQSGGANITFEQTYSVPPQIAFAITTYSGNDGLFDEDFFMRTVRVTQSLAELNIFMQGVTNIRILYVMYMAIHPDFLYHLNSFNDIEANYSLGTLSLSPIDTYTSSVRVFTNYINYTQLCESINARHKYFGSDMTKNKIAVYLSGIFNYVKNGDLPEIKFDIVTEPLNASFFKLEVSVNPNYRIDLLRLSFIAMDIANIETSGEYTIVYNTQRYYFDKNNYIPLESEFFGDVFIGMLDFNTQSPSCTIDFQLVFDPANSQIIAKKSQPHPSLGNGNRCGLKSARLVTFYMKTWYCPAPYYYFNLLTDMCDDYCASYLYGNETAGQCRPCPIGCERCNPLNPDQCTHCDSVTDYRQLVNGSCQCMEGYYQQTASDHICTPCTNVVPQCDKCSLGTSLVCLSCNLGWYLNSSGQCQQCNMVGCLDCISSQQCLVCDISSNYTLVPNKTCSQCPYACVCDGYYLPILIDTATGTQKCTTKCGDGLKRQSQQCDDGNVMNNDGCNSLCEIESYWSCQQDVNGLTCCIIKQEQMYIKVDSILKSKGENAFQITLSLYPHLAFLSAQKLKSSLNISLTGIKTSKQEITIQETQKIKLKYYYEENVQKKQCNITLKIQIQQSSNLDCSMSVQTSMKFYPDAANNQPLLFFDPQNYQKQQQADNIVEALMYGSYAILVLSALPCKIIGLQLFGVLQLAYFSLAQISNLNLMMVPFIGFDASNGFNPNFLVSQQNLPQKISSIRYDSMFLNNCGLMLGVMILEALLGLMLYVISVFLKQNNCCSSIAKRLLKQGFLTLIVFNSFNFAFATGVHFKYTYPHQQGYLLNSILAIISLIAPLLIVFGLTMTSPQQFGQFKNKFKEQRINQSYFVITILYRYGMGYFIATKAQQELGSLLTILFSLFFILYNFINLPFKSALHNYRANLCHLSQLGILVIANYYESMKATTELEIKSLIFSPAYLEIGLIIVTMAFSFVTLVYEIYTFVKSLLKNNFINNNSNSSDENSSSKLCTQESGNISKSKPKSSSKRIKSQQSQINISNLIENNLFTEN